MKVITDKGTLTGVDKVEWYGCDLHVFTGDQYQTITEPEYIAIEEE